MDWDLQPRATIRRVDLHQRYGGPRQGGISPSKSTLNVLIFSDSVRGAQHGYIDDWQADGLFHYTGEGQRADQQFELDAGAVTVVLEGYVSEHLEELASERWTSSAASVGAVADLEAVRGPHQATRSPDLSASARHAQQSSAGDSQHQIREPCHVEMDQPRLSTIGPCYVVGVTHLRSRLGHPSIRRPSSNRVLMNQARPNFPVEHSRLREPTEIGGRQRRAEMRELLVGAVYFASEKNGFSGTTRPMGDHPRAPRGR
jgi:hypothetical protein